MPSCSSCVLSEMEDWLTSDNRMTSQIAKSGTILYYNVQCQTENDEDRWQNCTIEITEGDFLMWHVTSRDEDDDLLKGSVQLGPEYEILTDKTGIPNDAPSVPKDYTLEQLFGIMLSEIRVVYWFIDTTDGQEWVKLMESVFLEQRASLDVTVSCEDTSFEQKSPDTATDKSSLTHLVKDSNSSPAVEQCQEPITVQPLPSVQFLPGKKKSTGPKLPLSPEVGEIVDETCIDICYHFFYYLCSFRPCFGSPGSGTTHVQSVDGVLHHTSGGDGNCCGGASSCFCCDDCDDCTCECNDGNNCFCECGDCSDCSCGCGDCGGCDC